jgi:hypothetical protein
MAELQAVGPCTHLAAETLEVVPLRPVGGDLETLSPMMDETQALPKVPELSESRYWYISNSIKQGSIRGPSLNKKNYALLEAHACCPAYQLGGRHNVCLIVDLCFLTRMLWGTSRW